MEPAQAEYPLKPVRLEGSLLLDGQEAAEQAVFMDQWPKASWWMITAVTVLSQGW